MGFWIIKKRGANNPENRTVCRAVQIILSKHAAFNKILVGFVALRPKSTAMVIAGRSVHLTTLFPGQA